MRPNCVFDASLVPESGYRVRCEKVVVHGGVKPAWELVRSTGSNQSSSRGNETGPVFIESLGPTVHALPLQFLTVSDATGTK
jgi:hypothetical protein